MSKFDMPRPVPGGFRASDIEPTIVTSRPSRIHTVPRPTTTSQWKRAQGNRSSRAGMSVVILPSSTPDAIAPPCHTPQPRGFKGMSCPACSDPNTATAPASAGAPEHPVDDLPGPPGHPPVVGEQVGRLALPVAEQLGQRLELTVVARQGVGATPAHQHDLV